MLLCARETLNKLYRTERHGSFCLCNKFAWKTIGCHQSTAWFLSPLASSSPAVTRSLLCPHMKPWSDPRAFLSSPRCCKIMSQPSLKTSPDRDYTGNAPQWESCPPPTRSPAPSPGPLCLLTLVLPRRPRPWCSLPLLLGESSSEQSTSG